MNQNNQVIEQRLNKISLGKIKIPLIKQFNGDPKKLKGFMAQIKFKIGQEGIRLNTLADKVAFAGMFLIGDLLRWFEPYFAEI